MKDTTIIVGSPDNRLTIYRNYEGAGAAIRLRGKDRSLFIHRSYHGFHRGNGIVFVGWLEIFWR